MNRMVSVYIPTHNRRELLERTLKSILHQTYQNIEIIVVNDGSTDDTDNYMQGMILNHSNIKYLIHETPKGANASRNYALREANGYYVTGMDDDDEMISNRIEELVRAYQEKYAYIFAKSNIINDKGEVSTQSFNVDEITLSQMLASNITGNQVLTTKKKFIDAGLFDERLSAAQDYDMWIRLLKNNPIARGIDKPLSNIYVTNHERISNSKRMKKGYLQCYFKHKKAMNNNQRVSQLLYFRKLDSKEITSFFIVRTLFKYYKWPRLYLGVIKRKLLKKRANLND